MIATIYQLEYMPRLHYLHRVMNADFFVILDRIQFQPRKYAYHRTTPVKTGNGVIWLTVPVPSNKE
jgi:hypothetical protein